MKLFLTSAILTLLCYIWLALPPTWTKTPIPAIISFAMGHGFSPREHLMKAMKKILELTRFRSTISGHRPTYCPFEVRLNDARRT